MLGFQDECWWTRLAQPGLFAWTAGDPLRLTPPGRVKGDGPAALACYGIYRQDTGGMLLRFVDGRPVSQVTEDFLGWACDQLATEGKRVFVLVWDNAAWHVSRRVRRWVERHNRGSGGPAGGAGSGCAGYPSRPRGSTRSRRSGSTASEPSSSRIGS